MQNQTPETAESLKNKGNEYFKKKDYQQAIECYTKAIELDDKNMVYFSNRGTAYAALNNYPKAVQDFRKSIIIGKTHPDLKSNTEEQYKKVLSKLVISEIHLALKDSFFEYPYSKEVIEAIIQLFKTQKDTFTLMLAAKWISVANFHYKDRCRQLFIEREILDDAFAHLDRDKPSSKLTKYCANIIGNIIYDVNTAHKVIHSDKLDKLLKLGKEARGIPDVIACILNGLANALVLTNTESSSSWRIILDKKVIDFMFSYVTNPNPSVQQTALASLSRLLNARKPQPLERIVQLDGVQVIENILANAKNKEIFQFAKMCKLGLYPIPEKNQEMSDEELEKNLDEIYKYGSKEEKEWVEKVRKDPKEMENYKKNLREFLKGGSISFDQLLGEVDLQN